MTTVPAAWPADRLPAWLDRLLSLTAVFVLGCYSTVVLVHVADTYQVNHVSGVWIGLAHYVNSGALYPAVYADGHYAGTRYMPLSFTLHAGLARATGEYVVSGKLLSLVVALACGGWVAGTLKRFGCGGGITLVLTTLAMVAFPSFFAATTIRGDLLPVVWQLAALLVVYRTRTPATALSAGLLCTLAVLSKITAGWAALAVVAVTVRSDRKFLLLFLAAWLGSLAVGLLALHRLSDGRLLASFQVFPDPDTPRALFRSPLRLLKFLATSCPVLLGLMPFALLECGRALARRRATVYHWAWLAQWPILVVILADAGADLNHLVDLAVLSVLLVGVLWAQGTEAVPRPVLAVVLLWILGTAWAANLGAPVRDVLTGKARPVRPNKPLVGVVGDDEPVLTEDALVDVSRGRLPVVLDPYVLPFIERTHPDRVEELARRLRRREFTWVVLQYRLDLDPDVENGWYGSTFGPTVRDAIREHYRFLTQRDGFCVFVPR